MILEQKPCGDIWLHFAAGGLQASINLGHRSPDSIVQRTLEAVIVEQTRVRDRMAELELKQCVPGAWVCPKCAFECHKAVINPQSGAVGIDTREHYEICPNDMTAMKRLTWKEHAEGLARVAEQVLIERTALRTKLASMPSDRSLLDKLRIAEEALKLTAEALTYGGVGDERPDNRLIALIESERSRWTGDHWDYWNYLSEKIQACSQPVTAALAEIRRVEKIDAPPAIWRCRRCGQIVDMVAMKCGCERSPSPWEHVNPPKGDE
jgi:ribosomal protein L37AE/L43A